jgi:hypothetical protein
MAAILNKGETEGLMKFTWKRNDVTVQAVLQHCLIKYLSLSIWQTCKETRKKKELRAMPYRDYYNYTNVSYRFILIVLYKRQLFHV